MLYIFCLEFVRLFGTHLLNISCNVQWFSFYRAQFEAVGLVFFHFTIFFFYWVCNIVHFLFLLRVVVKCFKVVTDWNECCLSKKILYIFRSFVCHAGLCKDAEDGVGPVSSEISVNNPDGVWHWGMGSYCVKLYILWAAFQSYHRSWFFCWIDLYWGIALRVLVTNTAEQENPIITLSFLWSLFGVQVVDNHTQTCSISPSWHLAVHGFPRECDLEWPKMWVGY